MELKDFQSAIDNVKARKDRLDQLQKQIEEASKEYQAAVTNVKEMRDQFNNELDAKLEGVIPENAKNVTVR